MLRVAEALRGDVGGRMDLETIARAVAVEACQLVPGSQALLAVAESDTATGLQVVAAVGGRACALAGTAWPMVSGGTATEALDSRTAVERSGLDAESPLRELHGPEPGVVRVVPMVTSLPHRLGVLAWSRRGIGGFRADERALVDEFTELVTGTLGNAARSEALQRAYRVADEASRAKTDLMSTVAHELRTPLTVITGFSSLLVDGSYGEPSERWLEPMAIIATKVDELAKLVEDLLLASRLESGLLPVSTEELDLREVIRDAVARAHARARLIGAEVRAEVTETPIVALADLVHVDRILDNLLNNAMTYGGTRPTVRVSLDDHAGPMIAVEDNGIGIHADMHDRIFERFVRVQEQGAGSGSGLGLYICRQLAERQGGDLRLARSAPGQGSRFELHLRAAPVA
jgi:signal transduction histidine kinase